MDQALYTAAVQGNTEAEILGHMAEELICRQQTPKGNNVLHVAALHGHLDFVKKILDSHATSLLYAQNKKKETALHIAAREGHREIVSELVNCAAASTRMGLVESGVRVKEMLRMIDDYKDTALHKAARKGHLGVVRLLVQADAEFEFPANKVGETPLYLASELQSTKCLMEILNTCTRPTYGGPFGRTALHGAVFYGSSACIWALLRWNFSLCEMTDDFGWTPLPYIAKLYQKQPEFLCSILRMKSSMAYIPVGKGSEWTTIFHIAASIDSIEMMKALLEVCPDLWEMVNSKGRNVLHEAVANNSKNVIRYILNYPKMDHLIEEKDEDGNTPLHLLATSICIAPELANHPRAKDVGTNNQRLTPLDIAMNLKYEYKSPQGVGQCLKLTRTLKKMGDFGDLRKSPMEKSNEEENRKGGIKLIEERMNSARVEIIIAILIATITFAAAFTLPGGYDGNPGPKQGTAILLKKPAFQAFVITDTMAFVCSLASLFAYFYMGVEAGIFRRHKVILELGHLAFYFLGFSLVAVLLAFITGLYAVLLHSTSLGVAVCVLGIIFFPLCCCVIYTTGIP